MIEIKRMSEAEARERVARWTRIIEDDILSKLDHMPSERELELVTYAAELATRLRCDAACGDITEDTWKGSLILDLVLETLGLDKVMTVAAASMRLPVKERC